MATGKEYELLKNEIQLIEKFVSVQNLNAFFRETATYLSKNWKLSSITLYLVNDNQKSLRFYQNYAHAANSDSFPGLLTQEWSSLEHESLLINALNNRRPLYHDYTDKKKSPLKNQRDRDLGETFHIRERLCLPLICENQCLGVLDIFTKAGSDAPNLKKLPLDEWGCFWARSIQTFEQRAALEETYLETQSSLALLKKISRVPALSPLLDLLCQEILNLLSLDGLVISLFDETGKNLVIEKLLLPEKFRAMEKVLLGTKQPLQFYPDKILNWQNPEPVFLDPLNAKNFSSNAERSFELWEIKSACYLPFSIDNAPDKINPLGLIFLFSQKNTLSRQELTSLKNLLELFSRQLYNASIFERLSQKEQDIQHAADKNRKVLEIAQKIMHISSLELIYQEILKSLLDIFHFDTGFLFLEKKKNLDYIYGMARHEHHHQKVLSYEAFQQKDNGYRIDLSDGAAPTAHLRNNFYYFDDVPSIRNLPMSPKDKEALDILENPQSLLIMPVRRNGKSIGNFHLFTLEKKLSLSENDLQNIESLCSFIGTAIANAELYTMIEMQKEILEDKNIVIRKKNIQIMEELKLAEQIQQNMIPQIPPKIKGASLAALYKPMENIGGDFYDFILMNQEKYLGIFISDVSGHGVPAALITGMLKTILETAGEKRYSPHALLSYINHNILGKTNENFLTAFYGLYDIETQTLLYARASHNFPYLIRGEQIIELRSRGKILGIFKDLIFEEKQIQLLPGDKLFFYTDGLTETSDREGNLFEDILPAVLLENQETGIDVFIENVYNRLISFSEQWFFEDDICLIGLQIGEPDDH